MENSILEPLRKLVGANVTVSPQSSLASTVRGGDTTVLWDSSPLSVARGTLDAFRESVKRRGSKFYACSGTLSYPDFCVALICTRGYTLNHNVTPLIPARAYMAAWRAIGTASTVASSAVKQWLAEHVCGRTAIGFTNEHGLLMDSEVDASAESVAPPHHASNVALLLEEHTRTHSAVPLTAEHAGDAAFASHTLPVSTTASSAMVTHVSIHNARRRTPLVAHDDAREVQRSNGITFFFHETGPNGQLSQWYMSDFTFNSSMIALILRLDEHASRNMYVRTDTMTFNCAEQFMMYCRAALFGCSDTQRKIMESSDPREHKRLGRSVPSYVHDVWLGMRETVALAGNMAKFQQNQALRNLLLNTGDTLLCEASPYDREWGIGFSEVEAVHNRESWGKNILGNVLMEVRNALRK